MRLILIRHAESYHSVLGRVADIQSCTGLTEHGVRQAHQLGNRIQTSRELHTAQVLLSSPVRRARETADIIRSSLDVHSVEEAYGLREIVPGVADGMSWQEYQAAYGGFDLVAKPTRRFAPEGESWEMFLARVKSILQQLANEYDGKTVVAVTHAGFIVASVLVLFAIPRPGTGTRLEPRYTSLTVWEAGNDIWQLARYNDAYHLDYSASG